MPTPAPSLLRRALPLGVAAALTTLSYYLLQSSKNRPAAPDPSAAAMICIDGSQMIEQANAAAAHLFGSTASAMQGKPLAHFILRDLRSIDARQSCMAALPLDTITQELRLTGRRATDNSLIGRREDGSTFPLESLLAPCQHGKHRCDTAHYTVIVHDISARKLVHEQLARSFLQLRELSSTLQTIREEERKHIARELHDDLGQLLATLRVDLTLMQRHAPMNATLQRLLDGMDGLLVTAMASLRRIASNLRPRALDDGGLFFALQTLRHDFLLRRTIEFELLADEKELAFDDAHSTAIYRIVQEALTNIARHAEASRITIALHRIDATLAITIQDNGRGIAGGDLEKVASMGLLGMRERVWGLNGRIEIGAAGEQGGTRIDIRVPLDTAMLAQQAKRAPEGAPVPTSSQRDA